MASGCHYGVVGRQESRRIVRIYGTLHMLRPKEPRWPRRLSRHYASRARRTQDPEVARGRAEESLAWMDVADRLAGDKEGSRVPADALPMLRRAEMLLTANRAEELVDTATRALDIGQNFSDPYVIHHALAFLGLAALHRGDLTEASAHLLACSKVDFAASPALASFGPSEESIQLADGLLAAGKRNVVMTYMVAIRRTCQKRSWAKTLNRWQGDIEHGRTVHLRSVELASPAVTRSLDRRERRSRGC